MGEEHYPQVRKGKLRHTQGKGLAQGHRASKHQSWGYNLLPGFLSPVLRPLDLTTKAEVKMFRLGA